MYTCWTNDFHLRVIIADFTSVIYSQKVYKIQGRPGLVLLDVDQLSLSPSGPIPESGR